MRFPWHCPAPAQSLWELWSLPSPLALQGTRDFFGAGIFPASVLHHFVSHTVSTSQTLLLVRGNNKCKMKGKPPKSGILNHYWISISLHKLLTDTKACLLHLINLLPSFGALFSILLCVLLLSK